MLVTSSAISLPKLAATGDWPWFVTLYRDETHVCDGTLVSDTWVLTTESCFQGQPKATWIAALGNIRLNSDTPWMQRRRIVGAFQIFIRKKYNILIFIFGSYFLDWNGKISSRRLNSSTYSARNSS